MRPDELFLAIHPDPRSEAFLGNEFVLEFMFWIVVLVLSWVLLKTQPSLLQKIETFGKKLSYRRGLVICLVIVTVLAARVALLPQLPIPTPMVHDEFSYLFQASTFASGHLSNPTPAGWTHLETFHINMVPSYHSMYPPGQAFFLAVAEVIHASPWWGVWLSTGFMCGALCWMLQGWVSPPWALLGAVLCVVRFATYSYWINSYFGGSVAALGGALVVGALPRLKRTLKPRYALIFTVGLALLANTRPYEGLLFSIPFLCAAGFWLLKDRIQIPKKTWAIAPALFVLVGVAFGIAYYNWRCTGNAFLFPYVLNQQTYHVTRPFIWQERYPTPHYTQQVMRTFYVFHELPDYYNRSASGFYERFIRERIEVYYNFYIWPLFVLMLLAGWNMMKSRKWRIFPVTILLLVAGLLLEQWLPEPHYAAPAVGALLIICIYGFRLLWVWRPKCQPIGPMLMRSIAMVLLLWSIVPLAQKILDPFDIAQNSVPHETWIPIHFARSRIQAQMEQTPGRHIIFVHFQRWATVFWMYNDPDPQTSKVIWAYDMGDEANQQFMQLYPGRQAWFMDSENLSTAVVPYEASGQHVDPLISNYRPRDPHGQ
jgi:hypothetical protein